MTSTTSYPRFTSPIRSLLSSGTRCYGFPVAGSIDLAFRCLNEDDIEHGLPFLERSRGGYSSLMVSGNMELIEFSRDLPVTDLPVGQCPSVYPDGQVGLRTAGSPPGARAERARKLVSGVRRIQVGTLCRSNSNTVLALVAESHLANRSPDGSLLTP